MKGNLRFKIGLAYTVYTGREIYISKSIGNFQKFFIETRLEDIDLTKTQPCKYFIYLERGNPS